jgi:hypothetical protein
MASGNGSASEERFFIGLYQYEGSNKGQVDFFDIMCPPPQARKPKPDESFSFARVLGEIRKTYEVRNIPAFRWANP